MAFVKLKIGLIKTNIKYIVIAINKNNIENCNNEIDITRYNHSLKDQFNWKMIGILK